MSEWRMIPSWDKYEASRCGRIRRKGRGVDHAQTPSTVRRLHVCLCQDGRQKNPSVHSLVAEAFIGPRPDGLEINHIDGDCLNNAADNLEYVTQRENMRHASEMGLVAKGEANAMSSIEDDDAIDIVLAIARGGYRQKDLARVFGVDQTTITNIKRGRTWAHVTRRLPFIDQGALATHGNSGRQI